MFKTDISAVLTVTSGLDPHRLEFSKKVAQGDHGKDGGNDNSCGYGLCLFIYCLYNKGMGYANSLLVNKS